MIERTAGSVLATVDGPVAVITLNRPEVRNAIDVPTHELIHEVLADADADEAVRAIILTGTDPAFSGGVDLKAYRAAYLERRPTAPHPGKAIRSVATPIIAAVNGPCITGGLEIALSCDFVIASERATFADTHAKLGMTPGPGMWGMTALLSEAVGRRRAKEMSLTARFVNADEAFAIGLTTQTVPHDTLLSVALERARAIAAVPPGAVGAWRDVYDAGAGRSLDERFDVEAAGPGTWYRPDATPSA